MSIITKIPSEDLNRLMDAAAKSINLFADLWSHVRKKGTEEGFQEDELQDMLRTRIKKKAKRK